MRSDLIPFTARLDQRLKDKIADVLAQLIRRQVESVGERLLRHAARFTRMYNYSSLRWGHLDAPPQPQLIINISDAVARRASS